MVSSLSGTAESSLPEHSTGDDDDEPRKAHKKGGGGRPKASQEKDLAEKDDGGSEDAFSREDNLEDMVENDTDIDDDKGRDEKKGGGGGGGGDSGDSSDSSDSGSDDENSDSDDSDQSGDGEETEVKFKFKNRKKKKKKKKRDPKPNSYRCKVLNDWFELRDAKGHKYSKYLKRCRGNKDAVECTLCRTVLNVGSRGWAQINDHVTTSKKHKLAYSGWNGSGGWFEKHAATTNAARYALMKILLFLDVHNVPAQSVSHLIKMCKAAFPDSGIARSIHLGREAAAYHLTGMSKTIAAKLHRNLRELPFSLSFDAGTKGKRKRLECVVRYWCPNLRRVVERNIFLIPVDRETARIVADCLIDRFEELNIDIRKQLISVLTDSSSVNRGRRAGAIKLLANAAPQVERTDVGGDALHHVHNAHKRAAKACFKDALKIVDSVKWDITTSPSKLERYLDCCAQAGEREVIPAAYNPSRYLAKYEACQDRMKHIEALRLFYRVAAADATPEPAPPRNSENTGETLFESDDDAVITSDDDDADIVDPEESLRGNPKGRVRYLQNVFGRDQIHNTELELLLAVNCLKAGHEFVLEFQAKTVKIHELYLRLEKLLKDALLVCCDPSYLRSSETGLAYGGKRLKDVKFETKDQRKARRSREALNPETKEKGVTYVSLKDVRDVLLATNIKEGINIIAGKHKMTADEKRTLTNRAKDTYFNFHLELAKAYQWYLPLDNNFLRHLQYLEPRKFMTDDQTARHMQRIAEALPNMAADEQDDLMSDIDQVKLSTQEYFEEEMQVYINTRQDEDLRLEGERRQLFNRGKALAEADIARAWRGVLGASTLPRLRKLLVSTMSIFHATGSVEGGVAVTRHLLGDKSHRMKVTTLEAKKMMRSAVRNAETDCCHDFDVTSSEYYDTWVAARKEYRTRPDKNEEEEDESSDEEIEDDHNISVGDDVVVKSQKKEDVAVGKGKKKHGEVVVGKRKKKGGPVKRNSNVPGKVKAKKHGEVLVGKCKKKGAPVKRNSNVPGKVKAKKQAEKVQEGGTRKEKEKEKRVFHDYIDGGSDGDETEPAVSKQKRPRVASGIFSISADRRLHFLKNCNVFYFISGDFEA